MPVMKNIGRKETMTASEANGAVTYIIDQRNNSLVPKSIRTRQQLTPDHQLLKHLCHYQLDSDAPLVKLLAKGQGSVLDETQMAALPLQLYLYIVGGMIMACVYVFLWYWMMFRGGGFQQATQIKKRAVAGEEVGVKWDDIIGMEETKQEAFEVVKLISDRAQLKRLGGKILRGILMLGPPGCGKTYLAKGIATASNLPFITTSGSEFVEMFVGVGASRIRKLFKQARQSIRSEKG